MFFMDMLIEVLIVFLKHSSVFATNITFIFFIVIHFISLCSQLCKSVNHNTTHNVTKQQVKENEID